MLTGRGLNSYNLNVKEEDWNIVNETQTHIHFLDVRFRFNVQGNLQTDIYIKETDSKQFLDFNSCHPNNTFSSIVYSQGLRYRRIINDNQILNVRLHELKNNFIQSNYPANMVNNILSKVETLPRILEKSVQDDSSNGKVVNVISTYGRDSLLCKMSDSISKILVSNKLVSKFTYTKKTASSLRHKLCNSKYVSLNKRFGPSLPCNRPRCKNCKRMSQLDFIKDANGKRHQTKSGNCTSNNIIYAATCVICGKNYTGKSTQMSACRNSGHRAKFLKYVSHMQKGGDHTKYTLDDEYSLGIHLYNEHGIMDSDGFDKTYKFTILEECSPRNLDTREHYWIHILRSILPYGLNLISPFGLPLLD